MNKKNLSIVVVVIVAIIAGALLANNSKENKRKNDLEQQRIQLAKDKQEQDRIEYENEQAEKERRKASFDDCNQKAYADYVGNWNLTCENLSKEDNCTIPSYRANQLNDELTKQRELCDKVFN